MHSKDLLLSRVIVDSLPSTIVAEKVAVVTRRCGSSRDRSRSPRGCDSAAHRLILDGMSHLGRAMAFAARVWDANRGRFSITLEQAKWYSEHIDAAIEIEHELICRGRMPRRRFTVGYVTELLARPTCQRAAQDPGMPSEII